MPKHENAFYKKIHRSESGDRIEWVEVHFSELEQEDKRAEVRNSEIRERIDGNVIFGVRAGDGKLPHFFEKRPKRRILGGGGGEGPEHARWCGVYWRFLNGKDTSKVRIGFGPWRSDGSAPFHLLFELESYEWSQGAPIGIVYGKLFVPDILGRSKTIALTDSNPFVAVEVVESHFLSFETFDVVLKCSRDLPLVVCFMFLTVAPRLNQVANPVGRVRTARMRVTYYISDGSFWMEDERFEDAFPEISPARPGQYYEFIVEKLRRSKCIP